ncbi:MAG: hypothetical protein WAT92_09915 [Saprospiraceae bacterium]
MMKKNVLIICLALLFLNGIHGQSQEPEYQTIFSRRANKNNAVVRGYATIMHAYHPVFATNKTHHFNGGGIEGGLNIKKKLSIGISVRSIAEFGDNFGSNVIIDPDKSRSAMMFGLNGTYRHRPEKAIHLAYSVFTGGLILQELALVSSNQYKSAYACGFTINPMVKVEANLMSWISVYGGIGYRFSQNKQAFGIDMAKDLNGAIFQIGINFGRIR